MKKMILMLMLVVLSLTSGCSVGCRMLGMNDEMVYCGTVLDAEGVADTFPNGDPIVLLALLDLPISLIVDTVMLPVDLVLIATADDGEEKEGSD